MPQHEENLEGPGGQGDNVTESQSKGSLPPISDDSESPEV